MEESGFSSIFRKIYFQSFSRCGMDEETFLKYAEEAAVVEEAYLDKLRKLSVPETLEGTEKMYSGNR